MAFAPQSSLKNTPGTILRDYQHAADLFNVDQFRLAPKHNFLFHVAFGINKSALKNPNLINSYGQEINMLVKSCDLPSFTMQTETLNQYNRKKVVQFQQKYTEIGIKFHDDNMGLINQLWQNYYSYYYADPTSANKQGAYARNATQSYNSISSHYGFDNGSTAPFFNYIKIYQMARHEYVMYQLWNPMITSWNYNKVDYSLPGVRELDMKIMYEAVSFSTGNVSAGTPEGFGLTHYDTTPSPVQGTVSTSIPSFAGAGKTASLAPGILNNAINTVNTYQNTQRSSSPMNPLGIVGIAGATALAASVLPGAIRSGVSLVKSAVGGIQDVLFPGANATSTANSTSGPTGTENSVSGDNPTTEEG